MSGQKGFSELSGETLSNAEKLQRDYEETQNLLSSISLILIGVDNQDRITRWNEAAENIFGLKSEDVVGRPLTGLDIRWDWHNVLLRIASCNSQEGLAHWGDLPYTDQQGNEGLLSITVSPLRYNKTQYSGFLLLAKDITQKRLLEMQLAQARKLESIGQLAAGIAHEINTPIQFISDNIHFLKDTFSELLTHLEAGVSATATPSQVTSAAADLFASDEQDSDDQLDFLKSEIPHAFEACFDGVQRVSKIINAVRDFSHPGSEEMAPADVNEALEKTITVSHNRWKYVADVVTEFDEDLPRVMCFPDKMNQVYLNIIVNAADAIADKAQTGDGQKGTITITTQKVGKHARITFRDTGSGIPEAIEGEVFNPFFTTKELGKGTGQGLAISHNVVVEKHGGTISFESKPDKGTLFTIEIPIAGR